MEVKLSMNHSGSKTPGALNACVHKNILVSINQVSVITCDQIQMRNTDKRMKAFFTAGDLNLAGLNPKWHKGEWCVHVGLLCHLWHETKAQPTEQKKNKAGDKRLHNRIRFVVETPD